MESLIQSGRRPARRGPAAGSRQPARTAFAAVGALVVALIATSWSSRAS